MSCYMVGLALHESLYHNVTVLSTSTKPSPQNITMLVVYLKTLICLLKYIPALIMLRQSKSRHWQPKIQKRLKYDMYSRSIFNSVHIL